MSTGERRSGSRASTPGCSAPPARRAPSSRPPRLATTLYFGCEPGWRAARVDAVDFARLASPGADGSLLLYQPRRDGLDALLAMALKASFFEAVLAEPARIREEPDLPLVGYVADEFHRFATSDAVHGEQSFLDTCRSHGAFCLLATQSTRSIAHAMGSIKIRGVKGVDFDGRTIPERREHRPDGR